MAELAPQFAEAFRDYKINGNAASGVYQPEKTKVRALGGLIDDALGAKQDTAKKGQANGYPELGADGKVPASQLPDLGVQTVNGKQGANVNLTKDDIGLGSAANIAPNDMPVSEAMQTALATKEDTAKKGQANGYASLDAAGKIPSAQLPPVAMTEPFVVGSQATMLALTAEPGDVAIRTDVTKTFMLKAVPATTLSNWIELLSAAAGVMSINGKSGPNVSLNKADLGLGSVENIAPADMPISDATQQALDGTAKLNGAQTLTSKTLKAPVIEGYTEGHGTASGTVFAPVLTDDTLFAFSTTGNASITLPAAAVGKSFTIAVIYGGAHGITWAGAARRWPKGAVPAPTSVAGKIDVFTFICVVDGTWLAFPSGEAF